MERRFTITGFIVPDPETGRYACGVRIIGPDGLDRGGLAEDGYIFDDRDAAVAESNRLMWQISTQLSREFAVSPAGTPVELSPELN